MTEKNEIMEIVNNQDPAFKSFYTDYREIANYNQGGSYFHRMDNARALIKTTEDAIKLGLRDELVPVYISGSSAWNILTQREKTKLLHHFKVKNTEKIRGVKEIFIPGPIHIVEQLNKKLKFKTIPEIGTDRENIYYYNGQNYERAEEVIKREAHDEYLKQWRDMRDLALESGESTAYKRLVNMLNSGPSANQINEVMAMIRRTTYTQDTMNPTGYIPFENGILNLKTRKLEPFSSDLFYTYKIKANLLSQYITLRDTPLFANLLNTAFYETDLPIVLSYFAYTFYPDLPAHKVLFILGRERIGKGTSVRVLQGLMPTGSGSLSLARLLTSERFQFSGIEGKNLLVDSETKRKFRRGTVLDWSAFCNLFGLDTLSIEPKGKEARDYISKAKGIFLGNLPFISIDSPPAISRILIVETRNDRPKTDIKELDRKILNAERDKIATLFVEILFHLIDHDFNFPGQLPDEVTAEIMDQLADPVEFFIEEETEYDKEATIEVDSAYTSFKNWCKHKGIPLLSRQTFVKKFGFTYKKRRLGPRGNQIYMFTGCHLFDDENEGQKQVGYGLSDSENLKINASRERYYRIQLLCNSLRVRKEKNNNNNTHIIKDTSHKLDTYLQVSGIPENQAPEANNPVSNLIQDNSDIIYRKSEALATNIPFCDVFQRGSFNYYALDLSKIDINGRPWQSYILKSQEISKKEFETMRGARQ